MNILNKIEALNLMQKYGIKELGSKKNKWLVLLAELPNKEDHDLIKKCGWFYEGKGWTYSCLL